jgi:GNAT superfamily N-acetyltransferase
MMSGEQGLLRLRALAGEPAEMAALQAVLEAAPRYFEAVYGGPPGPAEARSTFTALPPGRTHGDKRVFGLYAGDAMIGVADVVRGWNAPDKAIIGLLLLAEAWQRRGLGGAFAALVPRASARGPRSRPSALPSPRAIPVRSPSGRMGFRDTGEVRPAAPPFVADIVVLEMPLARGGAAG